MSDQIDFLAHEGADELAYRVRNYWRERGAAVEVRVERIEQGQRGFIFALRSGLGLYLPPRNSQGK